MPIREIDQSEWYPVFELDADPTYVFPVVDMPQELIDRYERAFDEFDLVQGILRKLTEDTSQHLQKPFSPAPEEGKK